MFRSGHMKISEVFGRFFSDYIGIFLSSGIIYSITEFFLNRRIDFLPFALAIFTPITILFLLWRRPAYRALSDDTCYIGNWKFLISLTLLFITYIFFIFSSTWIFPRYPSGDFSVYVDRSLRFTDGEAGYLDLKVMHPAIYLLLASILSAFNGFTDNPILISRIFMIFIIILSMPLLYEVSNRLYEKGAGEISLLILLLYNIFWYFVVMITGLYANMLGIVLTLYWMILLDRYNKTGNKILLAYISLVAFTALIAHETSFLFLISIGLAGLYDLANRDKKLIYSFVASVIPIFLMVFSFSVDLEVIWNFVIQYVFKFRVYNRGALVVETVGPITSFLDKYSLFLAEIVRYSGVVGLGLCFLSIFLGLKMFLRREYGLRVLPLFWILGTWVYTLFTVDVWRISLYSFYPISILLGVSNKYSYLIDEVILRIGGSIKKYKIFKIEIITLFVIGLLVISPITSILYNSVSSREYYIKRQNAVYNAMKWIRANTSEDDIVVSIARWEFRYTPYITGRKYLGDLYAYPNELYQRIRSYLENRNVYVVIWNVVMNNNNTKLLIVYYLNDDRYIKVYSNSEITIFKAVQK